MYLLMWLDTGGRAPERSGERHRAAGADIAKKRETGSTFGYANESYTCSECL